MPGSLLFLACAIHPSQRPHMEASHTEQLLRQVAGQNVHAFYFENEVDVCDQLYD